MNFIDRAIAALDPARALRRAQSRRALAHYDAAKVGRRSGSVRRSNADADTASAGRERIAFMTRDLIRNTPFATRAQTVIVNNVVADGIIPRFRLPKEAPKAMAEAGLQLIEDWLDTNAIDAAGRMNLYGLQQLVMGSVVADGEVLVVEEWSSQFPGDLPALKLRVLEIDHLDETRDGGLPTGGWIKEGIEFDSQGNRVAYWIWDEHPGASGYRPGLAGWRGTSRRIVADMVHHIYRVDRPGQQRGVSWLAPVAQTLLDYGDFQDAQQVRQKVAAMFTAFRVFPDGKPDGATADEGEATLEPGLIQDLYGDQDVKFADPPGVDGYEEFTRNTLRSVAAALGVTYEALTGDLTGVNFSSARMGRMEMDRNISGWQWKLLIPQLLQPLGRSMVFAWANAMPRQTKIIHQARVEWTPPARFIVDPSREFGALRDAVRAGFASRSQVVRSLGYDPERMIEDQRRDAEAAKAARLTFDSDASVATAGAAAPPQIENKGTDEDV